MDAELYRPILAIPEGEYRGYAIRHRAYAPGHVFSTANLRCRILGGQPAGVPIWFDEPVRFHELHGPTGVWMTDLPDEQAQANRLVLGLEGHVLVGGLGLGYALTRIAQNPRVTRVTLVERSGAVIRLVARYLEPEVLAKTTIVKADLWDHIKQVQRDRCYRYDGAFYDIWQSDGERTFLGTVVPLLQGSAGVVRTRPRCWNEDVMRGQLGMALLAYTFGVAERVTEYTGNPHHDWRVPFLRWLEREQPSDAALATEAQRYAHEFAVGAFTEPALAETYAQVVEL